MKRTDLPTRVFAKGRNFYLVTAQGKKRIWTKLCRVSEGLPALYTALAAAKVQATGVGRVPALIASWEREIMPGHAERTQVEDRRYGRIIADAFVDFEPGAVETTDCGEFLRQFRDRPKTHNMLRAALREYMRYAEELGQRPAGTNPVSAIKPIRIPHRLRYITDSELRRIKVAACTGDDGQRTRSGAMLCALIDAAYLTGQRIGDLLALEWRNITAEGIRFVPAKTKKSTGVAVLIEWTPKLRDVERRLRALRLERETLVPQVFTQRGGQPYTYSGAISAWKRATRRAGVLGVHFHDIRARALTDKDRSEGMQAAQIMGAHSTQSQTADYVRHKSAKRTKATR